MKLRRYRPTLRDVLIAAVVVVAATVALLLQGLKVLDNVELGSIDNRFSLRPAQPPVDDIVIIGIDQRTLETLKVKPPLPRSDYAAVLDRVRSGSPRVIAVDSQFIGRDPDPAQDAALIDAIARDGPIVLATHEGDDGPLTVPAGAADAKGAVPASAAIDRDDDGVLRRMLYSQVDLQTIAVRAAEMFGDRRVERFPDNHAWIDFRGPPGTFEKHSFIDVMNGSTPPGTFTGKAVLIGVTDPVNDVFPTSASHIPMPGVEFHANSLWTVLAGLPLKSASWWLDCVLLMVLVLIPAAIGWRRSALFTFVASVGLFLVFLGAAQLAFNAGLIITVTYPIVGLVISAAGAIAVDAYIERRQRAALERTLGDLLPPQTPPAFFISYRRAQNTWHARDIRNELARRYGPASVFMDTSSIDYGEAFPDRIASAIRGCSVMLVLIGPHWLDTVNGIRRIDDPNDWVRKEIEGGLARHEAVVVPVLVDGAIAPPEADLPESLKNLASMHAVNLAGDDLAADFDKLLESIERGRRRAGVRVTPSATE
jgi:CHASE2 domain-containing sensor protein